MVDPIMVRALLYSVLIVAVAAGAPLASCCQLGSLLSSGVVALASADEQATGSCCCCEGKPRTPGAPQGPAPERCHCGPGKNPMVGSSPATKAGALALVGIVPPPIARLASDDVKGTFVPARAQPPPPRSLLALHCSLTI
jgi:hypothetical protein